jgi:hypothetical protein
MRHPIAWLLLALSLSCRSLPDTPVQLVRVIDARTGKPVAGAEVLARSGTLDISLLFRGPVGQAELGEVRSLCDSAGIARVREVFSPGPLVARHRETWGCWDPQLEPRPAPGAPITIALEPDQSQPIRCVTHDGQPGVGAMVSLRVDGLNAWSDWVREADGSLRIPHAQYWRALEARGIEVDVLGLVIWDLSPAAAVGQRLPNDPNQTLGFDVAPSGELAVTWSRNEAADAPPAAQLLLRWISAPPDPEDDELDGPPELPFGLIAGASATILPGILLGQRFELVLDDIPGWLDPRVIVDGPRAHGERIEVALKLEQRMARISGRVVNINGFPLADRHFAAWLERDGQRLAAEGDWLTTDEQGRFAFDCPPYANAAACQLVIDVDLDSELSASRHRCARVPMPTALEARPRDCGDVCYELE